MSDNVFVDYYALLEVAPDASREEIEKAFRRLARQYHPDVNPDPEAQTKFRLLVQAKNTLTDPRRRTLYDKTWRSHRGVPPSQPFPQAKPSPRPKPTPPTETPSAPEAVANEETLPLRQTDWLVEALYSRPGVAMDVSPQRLYLLQKVRPPIPKHHDRIHHPLFVCLVVDRSSSMRGENIQRLRRVLGKLLPLLDPRDAVTVIAFSDTPELLVPPRIGGASEALNAIMQMQPRAATEFLPALQMAYQIIQERPRGTLPWLLFFTDGVTYDPDKTLEWLASQSHLPVVLDAFGLGTQWDEAMLEKMTALTGGMMAYIQDEREAVQILIQRMTQLKRTYVLAAHLEWISREGVTLHALLRMAPSVTLYPADQTRFALGPLAPGEAWLLLWEWEISRPPTNRENAWTLGKVTFRYTTPQGEEARHQWDIFRPALPLDHMQAHLPPTEVVDAVQRLTWFRLQEKARRAAQAGDLKKARQSLHALAHHLSVAGEQKLLEVVQRELNELRSHQSLSPEGEKALSHGTRRLMLPVLHRGEG